MKSQLINAVWLALVMGGGCVFAPSSLAGQRPVFLVTQLDLVPESAWWNRL